MENLDNVHYLYLERENKNIEMINPQRTTAIISWELPDLTIFNKDFIYIETQITHSNPILMTKTYNLFDKEEPKFIQDIKYKISANEKKISFKIRSNDISNITRLGYVLKVIVPESKNTNNRRISGTSRFTVRRPPSRSLSLTSHPLVSNE